MKPSSRKTVFVGMSGGVDSSVTALLLKNQGYNVVGVFMRCWGGSSPSRSLGIPSSSILDGSCAEQDAEDARRVAEHIGIPFYTWDFEEAYKQRVVEYMIEGYRTGLTPNPDVMCNREIKFGIFLEKALEMGADFVATGHYVRIKKVGKRYALFSAHDTNKDQSYFLWTLSQDKLKHCLFPIGPYEKPKVRAIAKKAGLPTAEKKDSQGICFLGKVSIEDFLKEYIPAKRGAVLTTSGEKIGEHAGAYFYTIGQRHGLDLREKNKILRSSEVGATKPHYVSSKDISKNTITVAEGEANEALYRDCVQLASVNYIAPRPKLRSKTTVFARVRYRQPLTKATLRVTARGVSLEFSKPQKFVAEGQSAVWYSRTGEMLGGGVIV